MRRLLYPANNSQDISFKEGAWALCQKARHLF